MLEVLLPVVVGGLIGIVGGAWQSHVGVKNNLEQAQKEKREEAYLELIDALLRIKVDDYADSVDAAGFWPIYRNAQAKICLYGSERIWRLSREFEWHLHQCWDEYTDLGTDKKKTELIDAIRDELKIKY
ncbi:hypothetical protein [Pseudoflavonifractor phocaeensis]|uniref:hypothetical protein n=1 Tax=Pseudoflavonifractor phocaeensis TaxID=1870988 RepID=UPI001F17BF77|nr:hypothetical protein [Pseudoflavonifractor phocaeensis]MCF2662707.1 hypothetical protein [Pseudoflavonifractor phocaeensis]